MLFGHISERHLVRAEGAFGLLPVHHLGSGPALGRHQHYRRPGWALADSAFAGALLEALDLVHRVIHGGSHQLVHPGRVVALHEVGRVTAAAQEVGELLPAHACENGGVGYLVAVQMEDGQHGPVDGRVEKLVGVPGRRQGSRLGLAVTYDAGHQQVRVVECGSEGMRERIAQLSTLVDRTRRLSGHMAGDTSGERELLEQTLHAAFVARDGRIELGVGALQVDVGHHGRAAMTGTAYVDHVQTTVFDEAVEVHIHQVEAGAGAPVPEQPRLDVFADQRAAQQGVLFEIDLPDR